MDVTLVTGTNATATDGVAPTIPSITITSSNENNSLAMPNDNVTVSIVASESIEEPTVVIAGMPAVVTNVTVTDSAPTWNATVTVDDTTVMGQASFSIQYTDTAGNAGVEINRRYWYGL